MCAYVSLCACVCAFTCLLVSLSVVMVERALFSRDDRPAPTQVFRRLRLACTVCTQWGSLILAVQAGRHPRMVAPSARSAAVIASRMDA